MIKIITTVGTSLLTNYKNGIRAINLKGNNELDDCYNYFKNKSYKEFDPDNYYIKLANKTLTEFLGEHQAKASAEVNSINKIIEANNYNECEIHFLCTDSVESYLAGCIIKNFYENTKKIKTYIDHIPDLHISKQKSFDKGLNNLIDKIFSIVTVVDNGHLKFIDPKNFILNITGGFKAVIPYLTLVGQILSIKLNYIFEDTDELITIPQLPIQFDSIFVERYFYSIADHIRKNDMEVLRKVGVLDSNNKFTAIGKLIQQVAVNKHPISDRVLGYTIELKVYEYLVNNMPSGYKYIIHSDKSLGETKGNETDIVLSKNNKELENGSIMYEIKSLMLLDDFSCVEQMIKKVEKLKEKAFIPYKFVYMAYTLNADLYENFKAEGKILENITKIKQIFEDYSSSIEFEFQLLKVKLSDDKDENILSSFMKKEIEKNKLIKTINI